MLPTSMLTKRPSFGRPPPLEPLTRDHTFNQHHDAHIDDTRTPLIDNQFLQRPIRPGVVGQSASLPQYHRPTDKEYPISTRQKSRPETSDHIDAHLDNSSDQEFLPLYVK
jgi:hypothetical protein